MEVPSERQRAAAADERRGRTASLRVAVWAAVVLALTAALSLLSVSTVSYTYSAFMQRTYREVGHHGFVTVWKTQVSSLDSISGQVLLEVAFVAAVVVLLVGVVVGAWLLLVTSGAPAERDPRYRLSNRHAE